MTSPSEAVDAHLANIASSLRPLIESISQTPDDQQMLERMKWAGVIASGVIGYRGTLQGADDNSAAPEIPIFPPDVTEVISTVVSPNITAHSEVTSLRASTTRGEGEPESVESAKASSVPAPVAHAPKSEVAVEDARPQEISAADTFSNDFSSREWKIVRHFLDNPGVEMRFKNLADLDSGSTLASRQQTVTLTLRKLYKHPQLKQLMHSKGNTSKKVHWFAADAVPGSEADAVPAEAVSKLVSTMAERKNPETLAESVLPDLQGYKQNQSKVVRYLSKNRGKTFSVNELAQEIEGSTHEYYRQIVFTTLRMMRDDPNFRNHLRTIGDLKNRRHGLTAEEPSEIGTDSEIGSSQDSSTPKAKPVSIQRSRVPALSSATKRAVSIANLATERPATPSLHLVGSEEVPVTLPEVKAPEPEAVETLTDWRLQIIHKPKGQKEVLIGETFVPFRDFAIHVLEQLARHKKGVDFSTLRGEMNERMQRPVPLGLLDQTVKYLGYTLNKNSGQDDEVFFDKSPSVGSHNAQRMIGIRGLLDSVVQKEEPPFLAQRPPGPQQIPDRKFTYLLSSGTTRVSMARPKSTEKPAESPAPAEEPDEPETPDDAEEPDVSRKKLIAQRLSAILKPAPGFRGNQWMTEAQCDGQFTNMFYPDKGQSTLSAKFICGRCAVIDNCLNFAVTDDEMTTVGHHGVFGGLSVIERRDLLKLIMKNDDTEAARVFLREKRQKPFARTEAMYHSAKGLTIGSWQEELDDGEVEFDPDEVEVVSEMPEGVA